MSGTVHHSLIAARSIGPGFLWLVDPDKIDTQHPDPRWEQAGSIGVTAFLVGTSQNGNENNDCAVAMLRKHASIPLILFPGSAAQVSTQVDAVLFLSLLSGRNPDYLVGEQVKGTPLIRDYGIEPIPTGYILVDTGTATSVARESKTTPIPEADVETIGDHALCAEYMGKALVYLEAGSGAARPIAQSVVKQVKQAITIPLIVGGGMKTPEACADAVQAGADFVVVGTALETNQSAELLQAMVGSVRGAAKETKI